MHARWGSKVGEERVWYLRSIVLGLRGPEFWRCHMNIASFTFQNSHWRAESPGKHSKAC